MDIPLMTSAEGSDPNSPIEDPEHAEILAMDPLI